MKRSLVRQVIVGVLLAELVCAAVLSGLAIGHEVDTRLHAFDVMLRGRADSVLGAIRDSEQADDAAMVDPSELQLPARDVYVVLDPSGRVLGASPRLSEPLRRALTTGGTQSYFRFHIGDAWYRGVRRQGVRVIDRDDNGGIPRPVLIVYAAPSQFLWHEAIEAVQFDVLAGIVLLAITGAVLAWFLRRRLAALEELAAAASSVSPRSWDFVPPKEVLESQELSPIADAITELLKGLRAAFERQRQLTGDAAHELKTSIAVLKSSLQLLAMSPRSGQEYEAGLEGLLLDTERTEDLANRMLALARLQETPADTCQSADLAVAVRTVLDRVGPLATIKGIQLVLEADNTAQARLSQEDAETLCSNLVMNALQHTAADGHVWVSVAVVHENLELRVRDDGAGIPEQALPHVFERFYRADQSRSRQSGGAGLGLSICKALVERAGGSITVQSTVDYATELTVTLPAAAAERAVVKMQTQ